MKKDEVTYAIKMDPEWDSIVGNASAVDEETDRAAEEWICDELHRGNQWAWCMVSVVAKWGDFEGEDYLGCCSYKSEEDFKATGIVDEMKETALRVLDDRIRAAGVAAEEWSKS